MKKTIIRMAALVIAVVVMLCPLSVCYAASSVAAGTEEVLYIVWETLKAWGIDILNDGLSEFTENVQNWLYGGLQEYFIDEAVEGIEEWITGIQWIYDNFGRRILNDLGVTRIKDFTDWFVDHWGLVDNNQIQVSGGMSIDNLVGYYIPVRAYKINDGVQYNEFTHYQGNQGEYVVFSFTQNASGYIVRLYILNDFSSTVKDLIHYGTNNESVSYFNLTYNNTYQKFCYTSVGYPQWGNSYWDWSDYTWYPDDVVQAALDENPVEEPPIDIKTYDIQLPDDSPSYQPGYSIIYYPDGSVGYLDIDWPTTISVDNLPAIVSTGTVSDPGIQSVFLPIKAFINSFSDGFGLMTQLIYNLPSEIVGMALAIMGAIIIFGTIRIMKEH